MNFKNFPMVSKVVFGRGSLSQLDEILTPNRLNESAPFIFLVDDIFENNSTHSHFNADEFSIFWSIRQ